MREAITATLSLSITYIHHKLTFNTFYKPPPTHTCFYPHMTFFIKTGY